MLLLYVFVVFFVCRKLSPHLAVCSPYVISLCDFAYYVFGQDIVYCACLPSV